MSDSNYEGQHEKLYTEPEYISNPTRTALQLVPASVLTEFVDAFLYDFSEKQYAASIGVLLLATSFIQNAIEYKKGKALFKQRT